MRCTWTIIQQFSRVESIYHKVTSEHMLSRLYKLSGMKLKRASPVRPLHIIIIIAHLKPQMWSAMKWKQMLPRIQLKKN